MSSVYDDGDGKRKIVGFRLTKFQEDKLDHICAMFGITRQRLLSDLIDYAYIDYLEAATGRITINRMEKMSAQKWLDETIDLKGVKGLVPAPYTREHQR